MKLSISNIAWSCEHDQAMYTFLKEQNFCGLEIAPTRIFPENPYDHTKEAALFSENLKEQYGLVISSMQSIWYGITQNIFGSDEDRAFLLDYTKKAIDFARAINCKNLVFGCPRNRNKTENGQVEMAIDFFKQVGEYAKANQTVVALEPNPPIYNTNFINTTQEAFALCKQVDSAGFGVNVDLGTMIYYSESLACVKENIHLVNHIHISEPNLAKIEKRALHKELKQLDYQGFISIEMKNLENIEIVKETIQYVKECFD